MNTILKQLMLVLLLAVMATSLNAQKASKVGTVSIHTSANCGECKARLEGAMRKVKGVKSSSLDIDSKVLTVSYIRKKTDEATIRQAISKVGYDADDVKADQEAHDNLPMCCRKGGHD